MITIDQLKKGLTNYIDNEILPHIPSGSPKKLIIGTALALYISNAEKLITSKSNAFISALGIIDDQGYVDFDKIAAALKDNIHEGGTKIDLNVMGFRLGDMTLKKEDVDTLQRYIMNS